MSRKNQKGQAVLIILLSLSVVLVIVMYILSRTVTDLSLSTKDENSMRAFSAAEAGIEKALVMGSTGPLEIGGADFNATVSDFAQGESEVIYPFSLKSGEIATFWFSRPNEASFTGNQIQLCWGDIGTSNNSSFTPAIEFSVYHGLITNLEIARATFDPYLNRPQGSFLNNFSSAQNITCTIGTESFQFRQTFNLNSLGATSNLQFATVKILYNTMTSHKIGLNVDFGGNSNLPSQGKVIDSIGSYNDANRRIGVFKLHPVIPPIFTNAIYSGSGIIK